MSDNDDAVTLADIIEQLGHLNHSAKRAADTIHYDQAHARINDTLDLWEMAHYIESAKT